MQDELVGGTSDNELVDTVDTTEVEAQQEPKVHVSSAGLRAIADFLDACVDAGVTVGKVDSKLSIFDLGDNERETKAQAGRKLGKFTKNVSEHCFYIIKSFGGVELQLIAARQSVCKRVVVGTKEVPETIIPAQPAKDQIVVPARTEEIVEWQCTSLLSQEEGE